MYPKFDLKKWTQTENMTSRELVEYVNEDGNDVDLTHANLMKCVQEAFGKAHTQFQDKYVDQKTGRECPCYVFSQAEANWIMMTLEQFPEFLSSVLVAISEIRKSMKLNPRLTYGQAMQLEADKMQIAANQMLLEEELERKNQRLNTHNHKKGGYTL